MAVIALSILALALAISNAVQYRARRNHLNHILYVSNKLKDISENHSSEKLLLMTGVKELQSLLEGINLLLEQHQKAGAEYARMEMAMRRMLSNISHDIRTPLTVVSGYIETLSIRPDMEAGERAELLSKVSLKAQEVIGMMNTFFDLAKLESGDREIPLSRIQMNEVCRKNILSFYDVLSERGFEVSIDIPTEPIYAYANEEALDRILNNLISNAIKYGGDGNMLGLRLRTDSTAVYIDVTDRGKGIQEIHKDHIFERLYTLEDSRNRKYQGSGLGLTITKRLVEQLQGDISVQSKPYDQTIFTVRLKKTMF